MNKIHRNKQNTKDNNTYVCNIIIVHIYIQILSLHKN